MKTLMIALTVLFSTSHMAQAALNEADKNTAQEAVNSIKYNSENSAAGSAIAKKVRADKIIVLAGLYKKMDLVDKEMAKKFDIDVQGSLRRAYFLNQSSKPAALVELNKIAATFLKIAKKF